MPISEHIKHVQCEHCGREYPINEWCGCPGAQERRAEHETKQTTAWQAYHARKAEQRNQMNEQLKADLSKPFAPNFFQQPKPEDETAIQIARLRAEVAALTRKLDLIFGSHVLFNGQFVPFRGLILRFGNGAAVTGQVCKQAKSGDIAILGIDMAGDTPK